jgi:hypothetical protein
MAVEPLGERSVPSRTVIAEHQHTFNPATLTARISVTDDRAKTTISTETRGTRGSGKLSAPARISDWWR